MTKNEELTKARFTLNRKHSYAVVSDRREYVHDCSRSFMTAEWSIVTSHGDRKISTHLNDKSPISCDPICRAIRYDGYNQV